MPPPAAEAPGGDRIAIPMQAAARGIPLSTACPRARDPTAPRELWLAVGLAACAGSTGPPPFPDAPPLQPGELRVRLVFGADADLDLYVTGPDQETVYYANTPAGAGALDGDRRCGDPAPRVETASFVPATAGRYRVGIDHAARCDPGSGPASYRLVIGGPGHREERSGTLTLGQREPRVIEIEIGESGGGR